MAVDLKKLGTEGRNPETIDIDIVSTIEILNKINHLDQTVAYSVKNSLENIALLVDQVVESFTNGGRLIYMGAGTSGRIGVMDAVECPPTYGVPSNMVMCLMAGGKDAFIRAAEGAEDSKELAIKDLIEIELNKNDIVVGITASGRTPYAISGVVFAKTLGCKTGSIITTSDGEISKLVDFPIEVVTGAEAITGSTRMKSGTAQKMVCNMITTASMIKMGKVYQNLMVDVMATNEKLVARSCNIVMMATGVEKDIAKDMIKKYGTVKKAIFSNLSGIEDPEIVDYFIDKSLGKIRTALEMAKEENCK